jgi:tRNA(fMet)-specific endonuclease VapC
MLFAPFASLPFGDAAARHYAEIRHHLEIQGRVLGPNDLKIAATARTHGLTLVSFEQEFTRVQGLSLADWTSG